jgi:16S rRNA (cytidine1402-2'-O)-methyltransferase
MPLFVVCTPIGNLEDLSQRAVRVLREAEVIAAEDTRAAQHLLAHSGAGGARLVSFFEGNEARRTEELVRDLLDGKRVALISEAGTPGVSDPGERLVAAAVAAGVRVEVIPGPSAAITALVGSGLPAGRFLFVGFPPRDAGPRRELFGSLRGERGTLIFYESPQRLGAALADLAGALGEGRRACVARELTKIHEEYVHDTLGGLAARYAEEPPRGECTVVVAGASEEEAAAASSMDVEAAVRTFLAQGVSAKEIAARLALVTGKPKRQIYQLALALSRSDGDNDDDGA